MSRKNGRPTFRLSFNYSGGGFDPSCRPTCIMVEDEPRALSMAEIETKRQAGERLSMDDMLAIAQFDNDALSGAQGGSAFSDDYLSADAPALGGPDIVGGPTKPDPEQVESEPSPEHAEFDGPPPPKDENGNVVEVLATVQMDNEAVELAKTIKIGRNEVAYSVAPDGRTEVREGTPSSSPCVPFPGGFCLHTHPKEPGGGSQSYRLGFGEADWKPVQIRMLSYILNLKRDVFVVEYHLDGGYRARFVDKALYEGD
ncbi:MAG: hypothetical protein ACPGJW_10700 [Paracoccaceae bacterium]